MSLERFSVNLQHRPSQFRLSVWISVQEQRIAQANERGLPAVYKVVPTREMKMPRDGTATTTALFVSGVVIAVASTTDSLSVISAQYFVPVLIEPRWKLLVGVERTAAASRRLHQPGRLGYVVGEVDDDARVADSVLQVDDARVNEQRRPVERRGARALVDVPENVEPGFDALLDVPEQVCTADVHAVSIDRVASSKRRAVSNQNVDVVGDLRVQTIAVFATVDVERPVVKSRRMRRPKDFAVQTSGRALFAVPGW